MIVRDGVFSIGGLAENVGGELPLGKPLSQGGLIVIYRYSINCGICSTPMLMEK